MTSPNKTAYYGPSNRFAANTTVLRGNRAARPAFANEKDLNEKDLNGSANERVMRLFVGDRRFLHVPG
jgi:hypothetical protein